MSSSRVRIPECGHGSSARMSLQMVSFGATQFSQVSVTSQAAGMSRMQKLLGCPWTESSCYFSLASGADRVSYDVQLGQD
jgi:hypothetical protein